jgi:hypothetical protein
LDRKKFENRNRQARPLSEKGRRIARQAENKKNPPQLQTIGRYRLDQGAGLIGATVGAILVLFMWNRFVAARAPAAGDIREFVGSLWAGPKQWRPTWPLVEVCCFGS